MALNAKAQQQQIVAMLLWIMLPPILNIMSDDLPRALEIGNRLLINVRCRLVSRVIGFENHLKYEHMHQLVHNQRLKWY